MSSSTHQILKEQDEQIDEITQIAKRLHKNSQAMDQAITDQKVYLFF